MRTARFRDDALELRHRLNDAREVCAMLGLLEGAKPQARGLLIRCLWHEDQTPSCSVRQAADGTLAVHCFGCAASGDVLSLVAGAHQLDVRREFAEVLRVATDLAGGPPTSDVTSIKAKRSAPNPPQRYPPADEVGSVWAACTPVTLDAQVSVWLRSRALDPGAVTRQGDGATSRQDHGAR